MTAPNFPVVALGSSAGGLEPLQAFFRTVPPKSGMAFVVVSHLAPDRESMLVEILRRCVSIPVKLAEDDDTVEPDHLYVIPPAASLTIGSGRLKVEKVSTSRHPHSQIDIFFSSLAIDVAERAVGIILSGAGSDGTLGIKEIKDRGGLSIAQGSDHAAPKHSSMPDTVIGTGLIDYVLPPEKMMESIVAYQKAADSLTTVVGEDSTEGDQEEARIRICGLLQKNLGHDFSGYKESTFMRRVQRRMQVLQISSVPNYINALIDYPG